MNVNNVQQVKMAPPSLLQAGLIAASLLVLPVLTGSGHLDTLATISLCFLAFAIPILGISLYHSRIPDVTKRTAGPNANYTLPAVIGALSATIGITIAFFHIAFPVGVLFSIGGAYTIALWVWNFKFYRDKELTN
jgi:hypothetical protein